MINDNRLFGNSGSKWFVSVVFLIGVVSSCIFKSRVHGADPPEGLQRFVFHESQPTNDGTEPHVDSPGLGVKMDYVREPGSHETKRSALMVKYPGNGGTIYYPRSKGEIIPLFGHLYRRGPGFVWIKNEKEAFPDICPRPDSITIPLRVNGVGSAWARYYVPEQKVKIYGGYGAADAQIIATSIEKETGTKKTVAQLFTRTHNPYSRKTVESKRLVREGDILRFEHEEWTVYRIVLPDKERKVLGWVEIGPVEREKYFPTQ